MSDNENVYPSRLRKKTGSPVRGIGSAYAENQQLVGAQDPEEAARVASMTPEAAQREAEREEALRKRIEAMVEELTLAALGGHWVPDIREEGIRPTSGEDWAQFFATQTPATLAEWQKECKAMLDSQVEEADAETIAQSLSRELGIDPADPIYDPMTDRERRKAIEADLKPLDFEQMVFSGSCTQDVKVREGFVLTFRTLSTQHGLWLEWIMGHNEETTVQHVRHYYSLLQVAASLDKVDGRDVGNPLTKYVRPDQRDEFKKALDERMEFVGRMPSIVTDDLIVQMIWFSGRVRKLLSGDVLRKVGNS